MATIETACAELQSEEERDDTTCLVQNSKKDILEWKAHQLRTVNQDQANYDVLVILNHNSALLVMDWAMTFLRRKFRESQCDWFAKLGIPWHITVVLTRPNESSPFEKLTFVHVFKSCPQDSVAVAGVLRDVLVTLKEHRPELKKVYCKQDYAGCYHCGSIIVGSKSSNHAGIKLERFDFSDTQSGKGEADRQEATIKGHINVYLNEGHDVNNAAQMKEAMESNGGIPGVIVKYMKLPEASSDKIIVKWDGISALNNFQFEERGIRVWKAYKIGPGKLVPWKDIQSDGGSPIVLEVLESPVQGPQSSFKINKPRQEAIQTNTVTTSEKDTATKGVEDEEAKVEANGLFTCPEDGCIRTFQQSSSLQAHLDARRHKRALEKETLFDKARRRYAAKIIGERTQVPTVGLCAGTSQSKGADLHSPLEKRWALKTTKKRTQFPTEQFVIGEEHGKKADPKEVSNEMNRGLAFFLAVLFFRLNRWRAFSLVWPPRSGRVHGSNMKKLTATMKITKMQLRRSLYKAPCSCRMGNCFAAPYCYTFSQHLQFGAR